MPRKVPTRRPNLSIPVGSVSPCSAERTNLCQVHFAPSVQVLSLVVDSRLHTRCFIRKLPLMIPVGEEDAHRVHSGTHEVYKITSCVNLPFLATLRSIKICQFLASVIEMQSFARKCQLHTWCTRLHDTTQSFCCRLTTSVMSQIVAIFGSVSSFS